MPTDLDAHFSNVGYAKVIATLRPQMALAKAAAAEAELAKHFLVPSEPQAERLDAVAATLATRTFRRPVPIAQRKVRVYPRLGLAVGYVDREGATSLAEDDRVESVVAAPEMSLIRPVAMPVAAKKSATPTWGITRLRVPELWAAGFTGKDVVVGHLDTGIDGTHPALKSAIEEFA